MKLCYCSFVSCVDFLIYVIKFSKKIMKTLNNKLSKINSLIKFSNNIEDEFKKDKNFLNNKQDYVLPIVKRFLNDIGENQEIIGILNMTTLSKVVVSQVLLSSQFFIRPPLMAH